MVQLLPFSDGLRVLAGYFRWALSMPIQQDRDTTWVKKRCHRRDLTLRMTLLSRPRAGQS